MCKRYVPIYQCNHRDRQPQPEVYLCRRALDAFAWQAKRAPIISSTNGSFVIQKLAARTAGCLRISTTELKLFYQVCPGWCDVCLSNGHANLCADLLTMELLPFKNADVGAFLPWKQGVIVPKRDRTEATERVWVENSLCRPGEKYWDTFAAEHPLYNINKATETLGFEEHKRTFQKAEKNDWTLVDRHVKAKEEASRCGPNLLGIVSLRKK